MYSAVQKLYIDLFPDWLGIYQCQLPQENSHCSCYVRPMVNEIPVVNEPNPRGLSMPALRYNAFFHDVDKLLIADGWGRAGWVLLIAHVTLTLNC